MSLINDALKRTKEVQRQPSSSAGPSLQLRLLQTPPSAGRGRFLSRLGLGGGAVLMAVLGVCFRGQIYRPGLRTAFLRVYASQPAKGPAPSAPSPATSAPVAAKADSPFLGPESPEQAAQARAGQTTNAPSPNLGSASPPGSAAQSAVKPAPDTGLALPKGIRLQGIVFDPVRPSAMINGKTIFVGEMFGDFRLAAVDRSSVTLVGGGRTNLLNMR
jgi:hypothetical protein